VPKNEREPEPTDTMKTLLIKNGEIINADSRQRADVLVEDGRIRRIGVGLEAPEGAEVVNARGRYLFPGFIDPHVHIHLPFMGTNAKDTYLSASRAAVVGGTTTLIEMCCPMGDESPLEAFSLWKGKADGKSLCDYTFHMGVSRYDAVAESELREIVESGISSFKIFLAYKGMFNLDDGSLFQVMRLAKKLGVIVAAHCENAELVGQLQQELLAAGKTGPRWHYHSRPPAVEAEGMHHLLTFAQMHGTHVYPVHTSCREAVEVALAARQKGVPVWIETLIQFLTHDKTDAEKASFQGAKFVMSPPLREKSNQDYLWNGLQQGSINTLATDHAPFDFKGQKEMGRGDFTKIPNGIPSLEDRITMFWTQGVETGRIDLHRFVDTASTAAAKIFGLFPRKGTISVGADADIVIWDSKYRGKISHRTHHMDVDYNPYEGCKITGRPAQVYLRGELVSDEGKPVGKPGYGEYQKRQPTHF